MSLFVILNGGIGVGHIEENEYPPIGTKLLIKEKRHEGEEYPLKFRVTGYSLHLNRSPQGECNPNKDYIEMRVEQLDLD